MTIASLLHRGYVATGVRAANKKALLQSVAERLAAHAGLDPALVQTTLLEREKLGSTGFGGGAAIPHGRIPGLGAPAGTLVLLDSPVDYGALDSAPVDLVFALLTDAAQGADHLKTLATVSRALRDRTLVAKLRGAGSADAILAILGDPPQTRAA